MLLRSSRSAIFSTYSLRAATFRFGNAVNAAEKIDVLFHRQVVVERKLLRHVADVPADVFRMRGDVEAADHGAAGCRAQQAAQDADHGRLAGAIGSQETENLARLHADGHVVHGDEIAEASSPGRRISTARAAVVRLRQAASGLSSLRTSAMKTSSSDGVICRNVERRRWPLATPAATSSAGVRNRCSVSPEDSTLSTPAQRSQMLARRAQVRSFHGDSRPRQTALQHPAIRSGSGVPGTSGPRGCSAPLRPDTRW